MQRRPARGGREHVLDELRRVRRPDLPPSLVAIIDTALSRDRSGRFQTADDFQAALLGALAGAAAPEAAGASAAVDAPAGWDLATARMTTR